MNFFNPVAINIISSLKSESDLMALFTLSLVATVIVLPLTMVKFLYCISVGYGGAIFAMSLALIANFGVSFSSPPGWIALGGLLYGLRLAAFLGWREISVPKMRDQFTKEQTTFLKKLSLALALGFLYACMLCPALYALRGNNGGGVVAWAGVAMTYIGLLLEAAADQHKSQIKRQHKIAYGDKRFVGPTRGLYAICRHPNYLGEILFWTGIWLGGLPYFGWHFVAWVCGTLGLTSIVFIMVGSSRRLDEKQEIAYGGQPSFEEWKRRVKGSMLPRVEI